jgi:hypothetical protein
MLATSWNPFSFFLMLDYFSRIYFVAILCIAVWSFGLIFRIIVGARSMHRMPDDEANQDSYLKLVRMNRNLHSMFSLGMTCTSGCCVNQIFGVWFVYMARATDANPFLAFQQAWIVMQVLLCLLVSLDAARRYASAVLERTGRPPRKSSMR